VDFFCSYDKLSFWGKWALIARYRPSRLYLWRELRNASASTLQIVGQLASGVHPVACSARGSRQELLLRPPTMRIFRGRRDLSKVGTTLFRDEAVERGQPAIEKRDSPLCATFGHLFCSRLRLAFSLP